jgi:hypothetical protein
MGFAGRVEVAPAADEVEGILHRGSARGLCGGDRRRSLVGKSEVQEDKVGRKKKDMEPTHVRPRDVSHRTAADQEAIRSVEPTGKQSFSFN